MRDRGATGNPDVATGGTEALWETKVWLQEGQGRYRKPRCGNRRDRGAMGNPDVATGGTGAIQETQVWLQEGQGRYRTKC